MKKLISIITIIATGASLYFFIPETRSKKNVYYQSAEMLIQGDRQILVAPNGRELEFLEITKDDKLVKLNEIAALGSPYHTMVRETPAGTYAISLEGDFIVKYDISDLSNIKVAKKVGPLWKEYDYYYDIAPYKENQFLTAGENGITIWNVDTASIMEKVYDKKTNNVESYNNSIYAIGEEGVVIFNAERKKITDPYIKVGDHQHQIFIDNIGRGYFPGDDALKFRAYTSYKNMDNPSGVGNAATGFLGSENIYFANGWDVYKVSKDLKIINQINTSRKNGEWSAGLLAVDLLQGKRIVVLNGSDILLADDNLKILDEYSYTPSKAEILKTKTMKLSPKSGAQGQPVMVAANGFWPGEKVELYFGNFIYELRANDLGEIFKMAEIPDMDAGNTAVLIKGAQSGFSHSAVFEIQY